MTDTDDTQVASFEPRRTHKIAIAVAWAILLCAYLIGIRSTGTGPVESLRIVIRFLADSPWGALLFVALYAVRPLFLFSAGLLSVAGGVLFGPILGIVLTIVGSNLGAALAYGIGRYFMEGATLPERLRDWTTRMRQLSFETVFLLRIMYVPYDMVNYAAGLLRIRFLAFIAATMLGSLPGTVAFTLFGASAEGLDRGLPAFDVRLVVASTVIFIVSLIVSRVVRNRRK